MGQIASWTSTHMCELKHQLLEISESFVLREVLQHLANGAGCVAIGGDLRASHGDRERDSCRRHECALRSTALQRECKGNVSALHTRTRCSTIW